VHLTMDASDLAQQTLESSSAKALTGLALARQYLGYGFTTLRDWGSLDPEFPTVDLRNAVNAGLVDPSDGRSFTSIRYYISTSWRSEKWARSSFGVPLTKRCPMRINQTRGDLLALIETSRCCVFSIENKQHSGCSSFPCSATLGGFSTQLWEGSGTRRKRRLGSPGRAPLLPLGWSVFRPASGEPVSRGVRGTH